MTRMHGSAPFPPRGETAGPAARRIAPAKQRDGRHPTFPERPHLHADQPRDADHPRAGFSERNPLDHPPNAPKIRRGHL